MSAILPRPSTSATAPRDLGVPPRARRRVAVLGLDYLARKNLGQLQGLGERGYVFDVFANRVGSGTVVPDAPHAVHLLDAGGAARLRQLRRYLQAHAADLHHVEVYPGGRFAGAYVLLARMAGVPTMVVERGDLVNLDLYERLRVWSMRLAYRAADVVWYREPYQEPILRAFGARRLFFLYNAVATDAGPTVAASRDRDIDFLWVNRLTLERHSSWVVDVLADRAFVGSRSVMAGLLPDEQADAAIARNQAYARAHPLPNLELREFADPGELYPRARFFLLPADKVFCNNALLEAMAHGVVPLVSDVADARIIVEHGVDGFVFAHSAEGLREAMAAALALPEAEVARMSRAAVAKVRDRFSARSWCDRLADEYDRLVPAGRP